MRARDDLPVLDVGAVDDANGAACSHRVAMLDERLYEPLERVPFDERIHIDRAHERRSGDVQRRVQGVRLAAVLLVDDHEIRMKTRAISSATHRTRGDRRIDHRAHRDQLELGVRTCMVRSLEPSLTTTTSRFGYEIASSAPTLSATLASSLYAGARTLMRGASSAPRRRHRSAPRMPRTWRRISSADATRSTAYVVFTSRKYQSTIQSKRTSSSCAKRGAVMRRPRPRVVG